MQSPDCVALRPLDRARGRDKQPRDFDPFGAPNHSRPKFCDVEPPKTLNQRNTEVSVTPKALDLKRL